MEKKLAREQESGEHMEKQGARSVHRVNLTSFQGKQSNQGHVRPATDCQVIRYLGDLMAGE